MVSGLQSSLNHKEVIQIAQKANTILFGSGFTMIFQACCEYGKPEGRESNVKIFAVLLIFLYIFITGFHDESSLVATIITSRSLNFLLVLFLAFVALFFGTMFLGTKVAYGTVEGLLKINGIVSNAEKIPAMISATVLGAVLWDIVTWVTGIPSSSSHALIGALLGPFFFQFGTGIVNIQGMIWNVLIPLFLSPIIGYALGYFIFRISRKCFVGHGQSIVKFVKGIQIVTCILINAFQGSNDAQKGLGVLLLLSLSFDDSKFILPASSMFIAALCISFGLILGGFKMIKNVGTKIFGVHRLHSMSAQISSASVIISASLFGFPVSGTQIVNSAIMGTGTADRPNAVGWEYAKNMVAAWLITIPAAFLLSSGLYFIFARL